jgi:hypothetical protein
VYSVVVLFLVLVFPGGDWGFLRVESSIICEVIWILMPFSPQNSLFSLLLTWMGMSGPLTPRSASDYDPSIYASLIAGLTGVNHHLPANLLR